MELDNEIDQQTSDDILSKIDLMPMVVARLQQLESFVNHLIPLATQSHAYCLSIAALLAEQKVASIEDLERMLTRLRDFAQNPDNAGKNFFDEF